MSTKEIKEASCTTRDPLAKKREIFTKVFLPKHPPVLGEWFKRTFPDAQVRNSSEIWRIE
jgi:serine/threonine-protein kinase ATR